MSLKAPKFWYEPSPLSTLLTPMSWLYLLGHMAHQKTGKAYKASIPVICVGNAVVGGSGKTPTVAALVQLLKDKKLFQNPHILTRGYGGTEPGPTLVDHTIHSYRKVGDEAILLSRYAPVIVSKNRAEGAKLAEASSADVILMDDGLQNPGLHKDLKILVVDSFRGFGNQRLLPAGPLRSPLQTTLRNTNMTLTIGKKSDSYSMFSLDEERPSYNAHFEADSLPDLNKSYFGFAGIGHPAKFEYTLNEYGLKLAGFEEFADHHPYSAADMETLRAAAKKTGAQLITTEKDFVRVPKAYQKYVELFPVTLHFEQEDELVSFLKRKLKA